MLRTSILLLLFASCLALPGQSKAETIEYLIREMKSFSNDRLEVKEVEFSDDTASCKIKTAVPGQIDERTLEFSLSEADVYASTKIIKMPNEDYVYSYSLLVSSRGASGGLRKNISRINGTEAIVQNVLNYQKIKGVESAFTHLAELVTGHKRTFKPSSDWP